MKVNSSGPKSPYNMTRTSSVGPYHGTGIPASVGKFRQSFTNDKPTKEFIKKGSAGTKYN